MAIAIINHDNQVTIPEDVLTYFKLQAGDRLAFVWVGDELQMRPVSRTVDEVFGKYRKAEQQAVSVEAMNAAITERSQK